MAKRNKNSARQSAKSAQRAKATAEGDEEASPVTLPAHPPAKNALLLAVSILLFAAWFVFLLVTALWP
jgi:hypothetical protein